MLLIGILCGVVAAARAATDPNSIACKMHRHDPLSDADRQAGTNDAIQMPALERLGLVSVAAAANDRTIKEYSLTSAGQKHYRARQTVTVNSAGQKSNNRAISVGRNWRSTRW